MKGNRMDMKRIAIGLVVMYLVWIVGSQVLSLLNVDLSQTFQPALMWLVSAGFGGFMARRNFLLPALSLFLLYWGYVIYVLYLIAAPTGQASVLGILHYNWISFIASALGVVIGVLLGQRLSGEWPKAAAAT